jgi:hypothetical protein
MEPTPAPVLFFTHKFDEFAHYMSFIYQIFNFKSKGCLDNFNLRLSETIAGEFRRVLIVFGDL